jgi:hypothetical protein
LELEEGEDKKGRETACNVPLGPQRQQQQHDDIKRRGD